MITKFYSKKQLYVAAGYNRSEMCRRMTKLFGWEVDESGIRRAEERRK